jgi:hypothetical protein
MSGLLDSTSGLLSAMVGALHSMDGAPQPGTAGSYRDCFMLGAVGDAVAPDPFRKVAFGDRPYEFDFPK